MTLRPVTLLVVSLALLPLSARAGEFVAYSVREAQRRLADGEPHPDALMQLGGITHIAGALYDSENDDLIIVGRHQDESPPITLDDFAVCLRAVFIHKECPLVSIDSTKETAHTRQQHIRYEGGIENSALGRDMFEADVLLKRLALEHLPGEIWGVQSYVQRALEHVRTSPDEDRVSSRFWFSNDNPSVALKDNVFTILKLDFDVETEVLEAVVNGQAVADVDGMSDAVGTAFCTDIRNSFGDLAAQNPVLKRVIPIMALVALARGIESMQERPDLAFLLDRHTVATVQTLDQQPLLLAKREVSTTATTLTLTGGIRINPLVVRLQNGEVLALKAAVLQSRPDPRALVWNPPLEGWVIPGAEEPTAVSLSSNPSKPNVGFSLCRALSRQGEPANDLAAAPYASSLAAPHSVMPELRITDRLPAQTVTHNIGGVMLSGTATVEGDDAAQINITQGDFSLVVDGKNARISPDAYRKFITALWCVYYSNEDPGISIDPIGEGSEKHLVRYIGRVINTDLGRVMREADYLMKKWAVGTEQPDYPGFRAVDGWMARYGAARVGVSRRFWFTPEDFSFRRGDDLLLFDRGRMRLSTEYDADGLRGQASEADERFASFFTEHYAAIAQKHPVYRELFEYAKMVALAKHLKQQGVPLHWFLLAHKDLVLTEDSPGTVDQLAKGSDYFRGMTIMGGVDLKTDSHYVCDREAVAAISEALARMPSAPVQKTQLAAGETRVRSVPNPFSFDVGEQSYSVIPQHTLTSGKDHRGIRYQTDLALRQDGRPGLELVRYFSPRDREGGEFGRGWHLLIPYRVRPADPSKRQFLNAAIPQRMEVENLCTGQREALSFSEDRYSAAGYVPDKLESSQVVGLFLMSDASYRLADKLGNQFHFDQTGYLTDMFLSPSGDHHVHIDYADSFTAAFTKTPYIVRPQGNENVAFLNAMVPKRVKVTDLVHGSSEVLIFNDTNPIPGYMPSNEKTSRYQVLAILSNGGLQLADKLGNQVVFDPGWEFVRMLPSPERRIVRSVAMGGQVVTFGYTINGFGEVIIASSSLSPDKLGAPVTHVVRYEHDDEGRLCRVKHSKSAEPRQLSRRDNGQTLAGM